MSPIQHAFPQLISPHVVKSVLHDALKVALETLHVFPYETVVLNQPRCRGGGGGGAEQRIETQLETVFLHAQVKLAVQFVDGIFRTRSCSSWDVLRVRVQTTTMRRRIARASWKPVVDVHKQQVKDEIEAVLVLLLTNGYHVNGIALLCVLQEFRELQRSGWTQTFGTHIDVQANITHGGPRGRSLRSC